MSISPFNPSFFWPIHVHIFFTIQVAKANLCNLLPFTSSKPWDLISVVDSSKMFYYQIGPYLETFLHCSFSGGQKSTDSWRINASITSSTNVSSSLSSSSSSSPSFFFPPFFSQFAIKKKKSWDFWSWHRGVDLGVCISFSMICLRNVTSVWICTCVYACVHACVHVCV